MKKCPECGNTSYDGAPVCGNCGYEFPKPKMKVQKEENIFKEPVKHDETGKEPSTIDVLKENKLIIGVVLVITLIVIGVIIATGPSNNGITTQIDGVNKYSEGGFSFTYPSSWNKTDGYDELHEGAVYFNTSGANVEYYNITADYSSIYEVNNQRVANAQDNGFGVDSVQTLQSNGTDSSDVILKNNDGSFTRFVSTLSGGKLYVFKITSDSLDNVKSDDINSVLQSAHVE